MKKYVYFSHDDPTGNFCVVEEESSCPGGKCFDFFVHHAATEAGGAGTIIRASVTSGQLVVGSISAEPAFRDLGIEHAIMDALAQRHRLRCLPPTDPDDYEAAVWETYHQRKPQGPSQGLLQELPS